MGAMKHKKGSRRLLSKNKEKEVKAEQLPATNPYKDPNTKDAMLDAKDAKDAKPAAVVKTPADNKAVAAPKDSPSAPAKDAKPATNPYYDENVKTPAVDDKAPAKDSQKDALPATNPYYDDNVKTPAQSGLAAKDLPDGRPDTNPYKTDDADT